MPLQDEEKAYLDSLWKMYAEQATQARQHETLRANISTMLFGLAGVIIGLYQFTGSEPSKPRLPSLMIGFILIIIGLLGSLVATKHYERNRFHVARMKAYRQAIDA